MAARVRFPPKSWEFFQPILLCFVYGNNILFAYAVCVIIVITCYLHTVSKCFLHMVAYGSYAVCLYGDMLNMLREIMFYSNNMVLALWY